MTARRDLTVELTPPLLDVRRGLVGVERLAGDGGSEGDGGRLCVGRDAAGREFCVVRECERIRERGRLGGGVVVGDRTRRCCLTWTNWRCR